MLPAFAADFPPPDKLPANPEMPNPLVMLDGTKITTKADWEAKRRPELKELFEHYMYGNYPAKPEKVTAKVLFEDAKALGGKGTLREVEITFGPPEWPKIYLLVAVPNGKTPAPCFFGPNFGGNHLLTADEKVRIPTVWVPDRYPGVVKNKATAARVAASRPMSGRCNRSSSGAMPSRRSTAATSSPTGRTSAKGCGRRCPSHKGDAPGDETATIMWWAWGCHRAVDFLVTDKSIDAEAARGRRPLAARQDRAPGRGVRRPHRGGDPAPVRLRRRRAEPRAQPEGRDGEAHQHSVPALVLRQLQGVQRRRDEAPLRPERPRGDLRPRPVLMTNAEDDQWANPGGQFDVLKAAAPAYELYDVDKPIVAAKMPEEGKLASERLGYFIRAGKHSHDARRLEGVPGIRRQVAEMNLDSPGPDGWPQPQGIGPRQPLDDERDHRESAPLMASVRDYGQ